MTVYKIPPSMGELQKQCFITSYHLQSQKGYFTTNDVCTKLFDKPSPDIKYRISNFFSNWKIKGFVNKIKDGWQITEAGEYLFLHIDEITVRKDQPTPSNQKIKKIPLSEIKPIEKPFKPNLSGSAISLADTVGAVLQENQAYRDFLTQQLRQIADFLNVTLTFEDDNNGGS